MPTMWGQQGQGQDQIMRVLKGSLQPGLTYPMRNPQVFQGFNNIIKKRKYTWKN